MLPDRVSNPGPLTYESGALPIALRGPALKLTEQVMKVLERIVDGLIRQVVSIDDSQFGFVPGRGTTDAIFVVRQLLEKYLAANKRLYMAHKALTLMGFRSICLSFPNKKMQSWPC